MAAGSALNVKKVIKDFRSKAGIALPDDWIVNNEVNFTLLAMLGHIIWMYPDESVTQKVKDYREAYVKSLGGVVNISFFNESVDLGEKEKRHEICLKWMKQLKNFDLDAHQETLAAKFPNLILSKKSNVSRIFSTVFNLATAPFRVAWKMIKKVWRMTYTLILVAIFASVAFAATYALLNIFAPTVLAFILKQGTVPDARMLPLAISRIPEAVSVATIAEGRALVASVPAIVTSIASMAYTVVMSVPTVASRTPRFFYNAYESGGESVLDLVSSVDTAKVIEKSKEKGLSWADGAYVTFISALTKDEPIPFSELDHTAYFSGLYQALSMDFPFLATSKDGEDLIAENLTEVEQDLETEPEEVDIYMEPMKKEGDEESFSVYINGEEHIATVQVRVAGVTEAEFREAKRFALEEMSGEGAAGSDRLVISMRRRTDVVERKDQELRIDEDVGSDAGAREEEFHEVREEL